MAQKVTDARKTTKLAQAYLRGLYSPEAQALLAKHHFHPRSASVAAKTADTFPKLELIRAEQIFGSKAQHAHLDQGGILDRLSSAH